MIKNRHLVGALVMATGSLFIWNGIPSSVRPSLPHSPLRKSEQTVTVDVPTPAFRAVPDTHAVRVACSVSNWWSWAEGPPGTVHVLYRYSGTIVGDKQAACPKST